MITRKNNYIKTSSGVRALLKELFIFFSKNNYQLVLPDDIYPVYSELPPDNANVLKYSTYQQQAFCFPDSSKAVALISNPIVPQGKYLTTTQLININEWLNEDDTRWLIIDCVYDYKGRSTVYEFESDNVVYVNSLSKLALTPATFGWALSKTKLQGFEKVKKETVKTTYVSFLQKHYESAWDSLRPQLSYIDPLWRAPEVGYLSTINSGYKSLLKHGIAALPGSVFGLKQKNISVISCLSKVKSDIFEK